MTYRYLKSNLRQSDLQLILMPQLEEEHRIELQVVKKHYSLSIIMGGMMCKFAIVLAYLQSLEYSNQQQTQANHSLRDWVGYLITILSQLYIGIMIDLISLQSMFVFSAIISIIGQISLVYSFIYQSELRILVTVHMCSFAFSSIYVCGLCMIFDCSPTLKQRFLYTGVTQIGGEYLAYILTIAQSKSENANATATQFYMTLLSIVIFFSGNVFVLFSYSDINQVLMKSSKYIKHLTSKGAGLSIKTIYQQYNHSHIAYLAMVSFLSPDIAPIQTIFSSTLSSYSGTSFQTYQKLFEGSPYIGAFILGISIVVYTQKGADFVTRSYDLVQRTIHVLVLVYLVAFLTVGIVNWSSSSLSYEVVLILLIPCLILLGVARFIFYLVCNQMLFCLQGELVALRGVGMGMFGFLQDFSQGLFVFDIDEWLKLFLFFLLAVFSSILDYQYRRKSTIKKLIKEVNIHVDSENESNSGISSSEQSLLRNPSD